MALIFPSSPTNGQTYQSGSSATYQYNGQFWTVITPPTVVFASAASSSWASNLVDNDWVDAGAITIGATTTAPTKGTTRIYDDVRYRKINSTTHEVEYNYAQTGSSGASAGSGDYLFSLPAGVSWGPGVQQTTSNVAITYTCRALVGVGQVINSVQQRLATVIPYNATQFRILANNVGGDHEIVSSTYYSVTGQNSSYKLRFYTSVQ